MSGPAVAAPGFDSIVQAKHDFDFRLSLSVNPAPAMVDTDSVARAYVAEISSVEQRSHPMVAHQAQSEPSGSRLPDTIGDGDATLTGCELAAATLNALSGQLAILDQTGRITDVNDTWRRFAEANGGKDGQLGVGCSYLEVCENATGPCSEEAAVVAEGIRDVLAGRCDHFSIEYPCHAPDERRWFIVRVTLVIGYEPQRVVVTHENITERKLAELALEDTQQRYAATIKGSQSAIWDWDLITNRVHYANSWAKLLGCDIESFSDSPEEWFSRIVPEHRDEFRKALSRHIEGDTDAVDQHIRMQRADGSVIWVLCRAAAWRNSAGRATRMAGSLSDITELKDTQSKLQWLATHDSLTGLANRKLFAQRVREAIEHRRNSASAQFAVFMIDFDRFKLVNDTLGHDLGDALLKRIADRFRAEANERALVARFGGDEFAMLLPDATREEARRVAERLVATFAVSHDLDGHEMVSTASIGVVHSEMGHDAVEPLLRDADAAMYQAKNQGKNSFRFFDAGLQLNIAMDLDLERRLWGDPYGGDFEVVYQPIISLRDGALCAFESLVRWNHPTQGLIAPDRFIRIAEESGSIVPLGKWILQQACAQVGAWRNRYHMAEFGITVNISKRQLTDPTFADVVREVLDRSGVPASGLTLEVTESVVMSDQEQVLAMLGWLREIGVRLALDDFGRGESSLNCLHEFPIDWLKIDRSFIWQMSTRRKFAAVINAIVDLAQNLNLEVVAEGIEQAEQLAQLQAMDVAYGQGCHLSRPMQPTDADAWLAAHTKTMAGSRIICGLE